MATTLPSFHEVFGKFTTPSLPAAPAPLVPAPVQMQPVHQILMPSPKAKRAAPVTQSVHRFAPTQYPSPMFVAHSTQSVLSPAFSVTPAAEPATSNRPAAGGMRERTGRWTKEEGDLFLEGLRLYGKDWKRISKLVKTRTLVQIRTHAQKVFQKLGHNTVSSFVVGEKRAAEEKKRASPTQVHTVPLPAQQDLSPMDALASLAKRRKLE